MKKSFKVIAATAGIGTLLWGTTLFASSSFSEPLKQKLNNTVVLHIGQAKAYVNSVLSTVDSTNSEVYPLIKDGRTLVPVRFISENIGAEVEWNYISKSVIVICNNKIINIPVGSSQFTINGVKKELDVPAQIINGRTFIPLRALVEALGKNIFWDDRGIIVISDSKEIFSSNTDSQLVDELEQKFTASEDIQSSLEEVQHLSDVIRVKSSMILVNLTMNKFYVDNKKLPNENEINEMLKKYGNGKTLAELNVSVVYNNDGTATISNTNTKVTKIEVQDKVINPDEIKGKMSGNTIGNIANGAGMAYEDGWIYYIDNSKNYRLYKAKADGTEVIDLGEDMVSDINILNNNIYYIKKWSEASSSGQIYKMKNDGTEKVAVTNAKYDSKLSVVGDWIYFLRDANGLKIYKVKTDGTGLTMVSNTEVHYLSRSLAVVGDWIYFSGYENGTGSQAALFKVKTDGSLEIPIQINNGFTFLNTDGYWIYYLDNSGDIYRSDLNGENRIKLNEENEEISSINVVGNWILYRNKADKYSLYKMKLDGTNKTKISNNGWYVVDAVEVDGTIYYLDKPLDKSFTKLRKVNAAR